MFSTARHLSLRWSGNGERASGRHVAYHFFNFSFSLFYTSHFNPGQDHEQRIPVLTMSNNTTTYPPSKTGETEPEHNHVRSGLEEYERSLEGRPPWMLTTTELKLLGIAGVGFFLDGEPRT